MGTTNWRIKLSRSKGSSQERLNAHHLKTGIIPTDYYAVTRDKYGKPRIKPVVPEPAVKPPMSLMKQSRRNACMRRLALRVKRKEIDPRLAMDVLTPLVLSGKASRSTVYTEQYNGVYAHA